MEKVIEHVQKNKASQLAWQVTELALGVFFGALALYPDQTLSFIKSGLESNNYAALKVLGLVVIFFHRKSIIRKIKLYAFKYMARRSMRTGTEVNQLGEKLIDGIPVSELVDYLIRNQKFIREGDNGVRSTFDLDMKKFNRLAKRLEDNKVLVRGENNCRQLSPNWTRQALSDYLSGSTRSSELQPKITIRRIGNSGKIRLMKSELNVA